jgi:putative DeoR family transcriptional regulator (stage III sporulation protein D)
MEGLPLNALLEKRARDLGLYILETGATVRAAAKRFGISKSTVHTDVSKRLKDIDFELYERVRDVLDENKAERHIRGGVATKEKYRRINLSKIHKN